MFKDDFYWELKKFGIDDETIYYNDYDRSSVRKNVSYDDEYYKGEIVEKPSRFDWDEYSDGDDYSGWDYCMAS